MITSEFITWVRDTQGFVPRNLSKAKWALVQRLGIAHHSGWTLSGSEFWRINHDAIRVINRALREESEARVSMIDLELANYMWWFQGKPYTVIARHFGIYLPVMKTALKKWRKVNRPLNPRREPVN